MDIPDDLYQFLSQPENRHLTLTEGEVRDLTFFAPEELKLQKFIVDSFELHVNGSLETDPQEQREFEAFSLIKSCNDYSPRGVIAWFPQLRAYGSADIDHGRIIIFPDVDWTEIMRGPTWYINGSWYPDRVANKEVNPWA